MRTIYVQCEQNPVDGLTATLHGDQMLVSDRDGLNSYTEQDLYRLKRLIPTSYIPKLHEALLIKAFCILTDNNGEYSKEGSDQHLLTCGNTTFTFTYKETDDE